MDGGEVQPTVAHWPGGRHVFSLHRQKPNRNPRAGRWTTANLSPYQNIIQHSNDKDETKQEQNRTKTQDKSNPTYTQTRADLPSTKIDAAKSTNATNTPRRAAEKNFRHRRLRDNKTPPKDGSPRRAPEGRMRAREDRPRRWRTSELQNRKDAEEI